MDGWEWDSDPTAHVLSANVHRRHLTSSQKAMAYAMLYPDGEPGKRTDLLANAKRWLPRARGLTFSFAFHCLHFKIASTRARADPDLLQNCKKSDDCVHARAG